MPLNPLNIRLISGQARYQPVDLTLRANIPVLLSTHLPAVINGFYVYPLPPLSNLKEMSLEIKPVSEKTWLLRCLASPNALTFKTNGIGSHILISSGNIQSPGPLLSQKLPQITEVLLSHGPEYSLVVGGFTLAFKVQEAAPIQLSAGAKGVFDPTLFSSPMATPARPQRALPAAPDSRRPSLPSGPTPLRNSRPSAPPMTPFEKELRTTITLLVTEASTSFESDADLILNTAKLIRNFFVIENDRIVKDPVHEGIQNPYVFFFHPNTHRLVMIMPQDQIERKDRNTQILLEHLALMNRSTVRINEGTLEFGREPTAASVIRESFEGYPFPRLERRMEPSDVKATIMRKRINLIRLLENVPAVATPPVTAPSRKPSPLVVKKVVVSVLGRNIRTQDASNTRGITIITGDGLPLRPRVMTGDSAS